jgi:cytochrome c oxidase subunit 2
MIPTALISTRHEYRSLFAIYVPIAAGVFAVVVLAIAAALLRYRRRSAEAEAETEAGDAPPDSRSENNPLEAGYAALLTLVVAFLLYLTFSAEHRVDTVSARERPSLTVDVTAAKWEWEFRYPRYGIVVRSGDVGRQPLVLPVGEAIRFNLASQDVIHAFWVPELDFKRDLIPGATETVTLTFTRAGTFPGQCAEFCGLRHPEMLFDVRALAPAAFARWARSRGRNGAA